MTQTQITTTTATGKVCKWDFQSDVFGGSYELLEHLGKDVWLARHLAPSDDVIDAIVEYAAEAEKHGHSYLGTAEEMMREIEFRQALAGQTFEIRLVAVREYAEMF